MEGLAPAGSPRARVWLVAVVVLAAVLRLAWLDERPPHADEAVQAYVFADLLEAGDYRYDPTHYHGPLPHYLNLVWMRAAGLRTLDDIEAWHLRLLPALAGIGVVLLAAAIARREGGETAGVRAALLAAFSPLAVYYSRMTIHETLLVALVLAAPWAVSRFLATRRARWLIVTGVLLGCLHAVKETWIIAAAAYLVAACLLWPKETWRKLRAGLLGPLWLTAGVALAVSLFLYSGAGRHPEGFIDAWLTFFLYEKDAGHAKPWFYYATDLLGFRPAAGWLWGEGVIVAAALASLVVLRRRPGGPAGFLAVAGSVQIVVYTLIGYKTPWLMLAPVACLVPWAAQGWETLARAETRRARAASACLWALLVLVSVPQAVIGGWLRPADPGIPFVYSPTTPAADAALKTFVAGLPGDALVAVSGENYWPLPWYFRAMRDRVGYFEDEPAHPERFQARVTTGLGGDGEPVELRPGYFLRLLRE